jgi:hypothetical protein
LFFSYLIKILALVKRTLALPVLRKMLTLFRMERPTDRQTGRERGKEGGRQGKRDY